MVLWNNAFWLWLNDDDGALYLGGHFLAIVEVYFRILRIFLEMEWFFTLLLSLVIQDKVVLVRLDREYKDIHPYPSFHHFIKLFCKGFVEEGRGFTLLIFKP